MHAPRVFLSHSSTDKDRVRTVKGELEARGISCWLDQDEILVGDSVVESVQRGLDESDFVVFFVSEAALASGWVTREVASALHEQLSEGRTGIARVLPVKLDNVELPHLLRDLLWADLSESESSEGIDLLARSITLRYADTAPFSDEQDPFDLQSELAKLDGVIPHRRFHWFIVSGPSSSGKDVLSDVAERRLSYRFNIDLSKKLTTRPRRHGEPSNIIDLPPDQFEARVRDGSVLFPYLKRHHWYGFDTAEFRKAIRTGQPLMSVFTHLARVPEIVRAMNARSFPATAFFIRVPREDLWRRVFQRNLPDNEVASRARSIDWDLGTIADRGNLEDEYVIVDNPDSRPFADAAHELTSYIGSALRKQMGQQAP